MQTFEFIGKRHGISLAQRVDRSPPLPLFGLVTSREQYLHTRLVWCEP